MRRYPHPRLVELRHSDEEPVARRPHQVISRHADVIERDVAGRRRPGVDTSYDVLFGLIRDMDLIKGCPLQHDTLRRYFNCTFHDAKHTITAPDINSGSMSVWEF